MIDIPENQTKTSASKIFETSMDEEDLENHSIDEYINIPTVSSQIKPQPMQGYLRDRNTVYGVGFLDK